MNFMPARLGRLLELHVPSTPVRCGLLAGAIGVAASYFIPVRPAITLGRSMEPTLVNGQPFLFSNRSASKPRYQRGDVLVLRMNGVPSVKRVAAVGPKTLWVIDRSDSDPTPVWALESDETKSQWNARFPTVRVRPYRVPAGTLFVVGDSPLSRDSREFGPVSEREVLGRVTWPPVPEDPESGAFFHRMAPKPGSRPIRIARR